MRGEVRSHSFENDFVFSCQISFSHKKVSHQASFWKWEFLELWNDLFRSVIAIKTRSLYRRLRTGRKFTIFRQIVFTSATKKNQHPSPPGKGWFLCCFSQATWAAAQHCLGEVRKGSLLFPLWRKQYWQNVGNAVEDKVSLLFLLLPMHSFTAHSSKWVMLLVTIYTLC